MKNILLTLILLPIFSYSQTSFDKLSGKWQEEHRSKKNGKDIDFSDTLRLEIRKDGFMMIRHTKGATITGQSAINGNKLILDDIKYIIVESSDRTLILNDEDGNHHFRKMDEFSNAPVVKKIPGIEEGKKDLSLTTIQGKWTCYKKTDPEFDHIKFYLKNIDFKEDKGNGTYKASVTFNNSDSVYSTEAFIYIKDTDFIISSDQATFKASVIKSDGEEMILQQGGIHYFMKQFGKKESNK